VPLKRPAPLEARVTLARSLLARSHCAIVDVQIELILEEVVRSRDAWRATEGP